MHTYTYMYIYDTEDNIKYSSLPFSHCNINPKLNDDPALVGGKGQPGKARAWQPKQGILCTHAMGSQLQISSLVVTYCQYGTQFL